VVAFAIANIAGGAALYGCAGPGPEHWSQISASASQVVAAAGVCLAKPGCVRRLIGVAP
jgi:hypothetical protein